MSKPAEADSNPKVSPAPPAANGKKSIVEVLFARGLITPAHVKQIEDACVKEKKLPLQAVVDLGIVDRNTVLKVFSEEWKVKAVTLTEMEIDPEVVKRVSQESARRDMKVPFLQEEAVIYVALADPRDYFAIEDVQLSTGCMVRAFLALPSDIHQVLDTVYGTSAAVDDVNVNELLDSLPGAGSEGDLRIEKSTGEEIADISDVDATAPEVERIVNAIILGALQLHASDIHIEPFDKKLILRYRMDGSLVESTFRLPYAYRSAIIAKLKIMTNQMDITERRRPQDGRIQVTAKGNPIEFRVNMVPTVFGEACVMRVLDRASVRVDMDKMGFLPDTLTRLKYSIAKPYGLVLVCGPTGSGKSTTLYAALNSINSPDVKILTAENPVEYNLDGIVQVNINQEIGFDFAMALRSFLRQDPDIIMVGEIRDKETAQIGMEAAMTGHLVFSTIHTNDAPSAIARLHEMGIPNFLISATIECVLAQRLVRRVCDKCKQPHALAPEEKDFFKKAGVDPAGGTYFKGKGCPACRELGYRGRLAVHELLQVDDTMRSLLVHEVASGPIAEAAKKNGMRSLLADGLEKVKTGITTLEEVLSVAQ